MPRAQIAIFAAVLVAATGLALLASQSLGAQRLLLEQAAAENERRAAVSAALDWRGRIDAAAKPFLEAVPDAASAGALAAALSRLEDRSEVAAAFALDRNGRLTWPPPLTPAPPFVDDLLLAEGRARLENGYRAEFTTHDTDSALAAYAAAGIESFGRTVRVEAKLQEAALAAKLGLTERAIQAYSAALTIGRYAEPERVVSAWLARAQLRRVADKPAAELDALALADSVFGNDSGRYGTALPAARAKVEGVLSRWPFSDQGRTRWDRIAALAAREREATEAREAAVGLAATLVRLKDAPAYAALEGGLLAAWRMRPGGACAGVVLRVTPLKLAGKSTLLAPGGAWSGVAPAGGTLAQVPGVEGLAASLPPTGEAAVAIRRQRLLFIGGLIVLLGALAAGLLMSFRAVRREAELARLKGDFVAQVSHELKTPLALVRMYAETLSLGRVVDDRQKSEYIAVILRESERLSAMIEKILDFAKLERGERAFEAKSGDIAAAARAAAAAFQKQAGVAVEVDAPRPVGVAFDDDGVALALRNLFENAAKYSEGTPQIKVHVAELNGNAVVAVEDRGIGVRDSDRDRVFERFFRSDDPFAKKVKGTGLGLALVARVMEGHGGAARCEARPGGGSRFILEFPRRTDAAHHTRR